MVDRTTPDTGRAGRAAGRLLVAAGLVVAGLFVGPGVAAADTLPVVAGSGSVLPDGPTIDDPSGCRIG